MTFKIVLIFLGIPFFEDVHNLSLSLSTMNYFFIGLWVLIWLYTSFRLLFVGAVRIPQLFFLLIFYLLLHNMEFTNFHFVSLLFIIIGFDFLDESISVDNIVIVGIIVG